MAAFSTAVVCEQSEPEALSTQEAATGRVTGSELSALARLRAGDECALVELVYRYQPALLRLAMVFVQNRALAEEVVQETWTGVLEGIAHFEGQCRIKTWIFGILIKRARLRATHEARSVPFSVLRQSEWEIQPAIDLARLHLDVASAGSKSDRHDDMAEKLIEREAMGCLRQALERLPPHLHAVVTLRDIEGLDSDEVCHLLGIGETNQEARLQRARARLRRALDKHAAGTQTVIRRKNANS